MIIRSVEMNNFMPYVGEQKVSFDTSKDHPVVLIYGENNRGKSSLFSSIKWAMYGEVIDRTGRKVLEENLLNDSAFDDGERVFSVTLDLESDGDSYLIQRTAEISTDRDGKRLSSKQKVIMRKNSNFVEHVEIQPTVNQIMNKEISIFSSAIWKFLKTMKNWSRMTILLLRGLRVQSKIFSEFLQLLRFVKL